MRTLLVLLGTMAVLGCATPPTSGFDLQLVETARQAMREEGLPIDETYRTTIKGQGEVWIVDFEPSGRNDGGGIRSVIIDKKTRRVLSVMATSDA